MPDRPHGRALGLACVTAGLALLMCMAGGAYAVGIAKNSVASKQIKNNTVTTKDIRNGTLTGADVAANSLSGAQVDEGSLGQVPNAATLGGQPASAFATTATGTQGGFPEGAPLSLSVPGYGTFQLLCDDNGTPATSNDDNVRYGYLDLPGDALTTITLSVASTGATAAETRIVGPSVNNGSPPTLTDHRLSADHVVRYADGRAIRVSALGYDDITTSGCTGYLEAQVLK